MGKLSGRKARGTLKVPKDPLLGGACTFAKRKWHATK
jgi:hypothetical protein